jgi:hypothetical protein
VKLGKSSLKAPRLLLEGRFGWTYNLWNSAAVDHASPMRRNVLAITWETRGRTESLPYDLIIGG